MVFQCKRNRSAARRRSICHRQIDALVADAPAKRRRSVGPEDGQIVPAHHTERVGRLVTGADRVRSQGPTRPEAARTWNTAADSRCCGNAAAASSGAHPPCCRRAVRTAARAPDACRALAWAAPAWPGQQERSRDDDRCRAARTRSCSAGRREHHLERQS